MLLWQGYGRLCKRHRAAERVVVGAAQIVEGHTADTVDWGPVQAAKVAQLRMWSIVAMARPRQRRTRQDATQSGHRHAPQRTRHPPRNGLGRHRFWSLLRAGWITLFGDLHKWLKCGPSRGVVRPSTPTEDWVIARHGGPQGCDCPRERLPTTVLHSPRRTRRGTCRFTRIP